MLFRSRERAESRNEADNLIYATEKSLKDYGDKVNDEEKAKIEAAIVELKSAVQANDPEAMKEKIETLKQASYKLAEEIYKTAAQNAEGAPGAQDEGPGPGDQAGGSANANGAEDADYRVVDDDDKK